MAAVRVPFERLKFVDQATKDLVEGFIRNTSRTFSDDKVIPSLVVTICILFYHLVEFFSVCGKSMIIDDNMTILKVSVPNGKLERMTGYGNIEITNRYNCIYSWTLKLVKLDIFDTFIGIDASNKEHIDRNFTGNTTTNGHYAINARGSKFTMKTEREVFSYGKKMNTGDIVKMEINTKNRTMQFWINGESQGIAFDNIVFDGLNIILRYHYAQISNFILIVSNYWSLNKLQFD